MRKVAAVPLARCLNLRQSAASSCALLSPRRHLSFGQKNDDGVVLPAGSKLHALHAWVRSVTDQGLVFHLGKALTLITVFTNDMYIVRFALVAASCLSMWFHFVFPDPRPMRMFYGLLFAVGHTVALYLYWSERSDHWEISDPEDYAVYEKSFRPLGFTKHQFLDMRTMSRYVDVKAGEIIHKQQGDMEYISFIIKGSVDYYKTLEPEDRKNFRNEAAFEAFRASGKMMALSSLNEGTWIGEVYDRNWDPDIPHYWFSSAIAVTDVRLLQFDKVPLHRFFSKGHKADNVESAALTAQVKDLWATRRYTASTNAARLLALEAKIAELENSP
jgi:hypothetical protein